MLCYLKFHFKQELREEEYQHTTSSFLFFLKKARPNKQKNPKKININYLIIVLIKIKLLLFLVFSQYELVCKYGIIFQISLCLDTELDFPIPGVNF